MSATKIGRNDVCPCGSGRKYKKCCQAADDARRAEEERAREAAERARPKIDPRDLRDDHDGHACNDPSHHHGGRRRAPTPDRA